MIGALARFQRQNAPSMRTSRFEHNLRAWSCLVHDAKDHLFWDTGLHPLISVHDSIFSHCQQVQLDSNSSLIQRPARCKCSGLRHQSQTSGRLNWILRHSSWSADADSFIADDEDEQVEESSDEEASTSVSPAASQQGAESEADAADSEADAAGSSFLASDDDLPSAASPHDPPFQAGAIHRTATRSSRRGLLHVSKSGIKKQAGRTTRRQRSPSKSAVLPLRKSQPLEEDSSSQGLDSRHETQGPDQQGNTLEQLGLIACSSCGNISHRKPSCSCPVAVTNPDHVHESPSNNQLPLISSEDVIPGDQDDSLPFAQLAKLHDCNKQGAAPQEAAGASSQKLQQQLQQQPQQSLPYTVSEDAHGTRSSIRDDDNDDDDLLPPSRNHSKIRPASCFLDESDDEHTARTDGCSLQKMPQQACADTTLVSPVQAQAQLSGPITPASARLAREASSSSDDDLPTHGRGGRKGKLSTHAFLQDAALDNDIEFAGSSVPAPPSRKRKRLRQTHHAGTISGDSGPDRGVRTRNLYPAAAANAGQENGNGGSDGVGPAPGRSSHLTPIGQRTQADRASKRRSAQGMQLQDRIKQHQQAALGGSNAAHAALSHVDIQDLSSDSSDDADACGQPDADTYSAPGAMDGHSVERADDFIDDALPQSKKSRHETLSRALPVRPSVSPSRADASRALDDDMSDFIDDSEVFVGSSSSRRKKMRRRRHGHSLSPAPHDDDEKDRMPYGGNNGGVHGHSNSKQKKLSRRQHAHESRHDSLPAIQDNDEEDEMPDVCDDDLDGFIASDDEQASEQDRSEAEEATGPFSKKQRTPKRYMIYLCYTAIAGKIEMTSQI